MRLLPELTPENTPFWSGGKRGELLIMHCNDCNHAIHPPQVICPKCLSRSVAPRVARGSGTIYTYTINYHPWLPDLKVPYALLTVDLDDEPGVRLTAQYVGDDPASVAIGQRVKVVFDQAADDVWIPQLRRLNAA